MRRGGDLNLFENELQKAVIVGVSFKNEDITESMIELKNLAEAARAIVLDSIIQNRERPDAKFFVGKGKIEEIKNVAEFHKVDMIIFNDELSGAQIRNIEESIDFKVIDRTALILDIFALRAKTKIAKLQVELAQLRYSLPRLIGLGKSMSRTAGGIGTRGPGEQKLEMDRRKINRRISDIKNKLKESEQDREVQKNLRKKNKIPLVALVGYTNSGKSTLMNYILDKYESQGMEVYVENMLFATLDTSVRKITLDKSREFLLSDTVGFVSKLPHSLVEAFKATLEEVIDADLLLHIVDFSNGSYENQIIVTEKVLSEIGVDNKESILVFNKIDKNNSDIFSTYSHVPISAKKGTGVDKLIEMISGKIFSTLKEVKFAIPYDKGNILSEIMNCCETLDIQYKEEATEVTVVADDIMRNRYSTYIIG